MRTSTRLPRPLVLGVAAVGSLALLSPHAAVAGPSADYDPLAAARKAAPVVVVSGLDNPRQLTQTPSGKLLIAQAGHGSYQKKNCVGTGEDTQCIGLTGKVTLVSNGKKKNVMRGLLSAAGPDGTFAVGSNGAAKRRGGPYLSVISYAPPESFPAGIPSRQAGKLISKRIGGTNRVNADITAFERRRDPDGEGVDSNPYSVLSWKGRTLVADAAGDSILKVSKRGHVALFHTMKEYGKTVDAVPTVLAPDKRTGNVLVGELHSEQPGKARVWALNAKGKPVRSWKGFTTVTGVARSKRGTLYVSELFGGSCTFDKIPSCFPGRVVKVAPDGTRTTVDVPFPAGVVVRNGKVYVNAFSTSPAKGFGGNPAWTGQLWRLRF
ncbi:ScyD/ScyE family protein [Solicola sp. PLA-1-18]|uniref:ScyD/ScyE family protein n=1 Tax=Solicola sp. PLA-1-18 TaxID=3380532 RepID=UPI003B7F7644